MLEEQERDKLYSLQTDLRAETWKERTLKRIHRGQEAEGEPLATQGTVRASSGVKLSI